MPASYSKPGAITRTPTKVQWTVLPAEGRKGRPPKLPALREWQRATVSWWADLWATPQAVVWDQSGRTLWALAELRDAAIVGGMTPAISAEMRAIEDRHGLNPKAMNQLAWRISTDEVAPKRASRSAAKRAAVESPALARLRAVK